MDAFGWSRAAISGASSTAFFFAGLFGILVGRLNDRFGPRMIMRVAAVFLGLGFALMSQVATLLQLYLVFGLVFGIGLSAVDVIALSTIARWFALNRGKMTGIVKVGTGAGQFTVPILASLLIAATGFQTAFIILGICAFALLMIIARFLYRDPDIYDAGQTGPAVPVPTFSDPVLRPRQTAGIDYSQALKSPKLWLLCLSNLLVVFCLMSIMLHIVPYARDMGISPHCGGAVRHPVPRRPVRHCGVFRYHGRSVGAFCHRPDVRPVLELHGRIYRFDTDCRGGLCPDAVPENRGQTLNADPE
jgi:MFS family permease